VGAKRRIGFEVHELAQQDKPISLVGSPVRKVYDLLKEEIIVDKKTTLAVC